MKRQLTQLELLRTLRPSSAVTIKQTHEVLRRLAIVVRAEAKEGRPVRLAGFGTFVLTTRAGRTIRNPATKQLQTISATRSVGFRATRATKAAVVR